MLIVTQLVKSRVYTISLLLVLAVASCATADPTPTPTAILQTVEVTRQVTREVTRIIEVPVTVTPTLTPLYTPTPTFTPTITPTPEPPIVVVRELAYCRWGPGTAYQSMYDVSPGWRMEVVGRNLDATWLYIQGIRGWNPCWVKAILLDVESGDIAAVHLAYSRPAYAFLYKPPTGLIAYRKGDTVTVEWNAVWMTEDDYRGYILEVYVCRAGQLVFIPVGYMPPLDMNHDTLSTTIIDEYGCREPSNGILFVQEKHGVTPYLKIPWPPWKETPTPSVTPSPTSTSIYP
jgi:hypothetical protein